LRDARALCWKAVKGSNNANSSGGEDDAAQIRQEDIQSQKSPVENQDEDTLDQSSSAESWTQVDKGDRSATPSPPGSWQTVDSNTQQQQDETTQQWIHLPPTPSSTKALLEVLQDRTGFGALARLSPFLERLQQELTNGCIGVPDFLEQLDEAAGKRQESRDNLAEMKKQAFRVAGDMGSAMKLLLESALPGARPSTDSGMLLCILDFLLDLCEEGEISTVAFFWPQICHIHLRMLPPDDAVAVARVDLMEDFLLTVASRYSVHLALELVWSHTADLEESMNNPFCSTSCRKRRFAVLRFVCELESILFDFDGGWGGGSVSLGRMLSPTGHQVHLLKEQMQQIQELRKMQPLRLSRSARLELLYASKFDKSPEEAAREKLRIARNADYFSCHLNFTRRLSDIAEKLRFMDIEDRAAALEEELNLLNASGTMGGDPLNRVKDSLLRVVRVPSTEGHVFRSKERTPVLLLMELVDEGAEDDENERSYDRKGGKSGFPSTFACSRHRIDPVPKRKERSEQERKAQMDPEEASVDYGEDDLPEEEERCITEARELGDEFLGVGRIDGSNQIEARNLKPTTEYLEEPQDGMPIYHSPAGKLSESCCIITVVSTI